MPQFETPQDAAAKLGGVFQDAVTDETLYRGLQKLDAVVRLQLKDPAAQITVKAKKDEPGAVDVGPSKLNPDVIVRMDADTAHGWLTGDVNPVVALAKGSMRATGAVDAILRLVPVAPALTEQYKAVLENGGRTTEAPPVEVPAEEPVAESPEPVEVPAGEPVAESPEPVEVPAEEPVAEEPEPEPVEVPADEPVAESPEPVEVPAEEPVAESPESSDPEAS